MFVPPELTRGIAEHHSKSDDSCLRREKQTVFSVQFSVFRRGPSSCDFVVTANGREWTRIRHNPSFFCPTIFLPPTVCRRPFTIRFAPTNAVRSGSRMDALVRLRLFLACCSGSSGQIKRMSKWRELRRRTQWEDDGRGRPFYGQIFKSDKSRLLGPRRREPSTPTLHSPISNNH